MFRSLFTLLALPTAVCIVWALAAALLDSSVFIGPVESINGLAKDLANSRFRGNLVATLQLLAVATLLSVILGALLGFGIGLMGFWHKVLGGILYAIYSIPKITLYPIFLLALGIGDVSRIWFAFVHGLFPMTLIVMGATANVEVLYLKLAAANGLRWSQLVRKILIPSILPAFVTATRMAYSLTLIGLVFAEMFSSNRGLGYELMRNVELMNLDRMTGLVVLLVAIAVPPSLGLRAIERRVHARYGL